MKQNKTIVEEVGLEALDWLTDKTNRSVNQTKFLFELVGKDWCLLLELEESISAFQLMYCPGDLGEAYFLLGKYRVWKAMNWKFPYEVKRLL